MTQKISIITPSFNQVDFVQKCLDSISSQSVLPYEHIIYDGGSTDGTLDILKTYAAKHPFAQLYIGEDSGQTDAINKGFEKSKGDIITWLNTDDFYLDKHVMKDIEKAFSQNKQVDFIYGNGDFISPEGEFLRNAFINKHDTALFDDFMRMVGILQPATFFKKSVFDRLGRLDKTIGYAFDYEYWVRAARENMSFHHIDRKICAAILHSDSKTMGQRGDSLKQTCDVGMRHYGFVSYEWADRLAKFEMDGKADGIINLGQSGKKDTDLMRKNIFMAHNENPQSMSKVFSHAHRKGTRQTVTYLKQEAGIDTSNSFIASFDSNFFDVGLTMIAGLQKYNKNFPIFIYDLGLTDPQKHFLDQIDNIFLLSFQEDAQDFHQTYFKPSSYGFKAYALWHCRHYMNPNDKVIWIDSGIYALCDMLKCFDLIEREGIMAVDHSDKGMWPFHNMTFCTDACAKAMQATGKELASPHMRAGILGYKIGGKFDNLFKDAFEYSLDEKALVGNKHPDRADVKPRRISNEKVSNAISENKPCSTTLLKEMRQIFGFMGHRHDQTIFSILMARHEAPSVPATEYCLADNLSSNVSKKNWSQKRTHEKITLPPDHIPEYYQNSQAATMQHRGTFANNVGIKYQGVDPENTAIILGNGPSLKGFDFANFQGKTVFGMNAAYRYWDRINWYPDYYACLDLVVGLSHKDEIKRLIENAHEYGIKKFLLRDSLIQEMGPLRNGDRVVNFDIIKPHTHLLSAPTISTGSHTAGWAAMLGYKNIYLMGIDCNYVEIVDGAVKGKKGTELVIQEEKSNPNYFFDGYQRKGDLYNVPNPGKDIHLQSWREIAEAISFTPSRIINANLVSKVDAFDFCQFEDIKPDGTTTIIAKEEVLETPQDKSKFPVAITDLKFSREAQAGFDETYLIYKIVEEQAAGTMIDVGAHYGGSARPFALNGWKIFCQEPDTKNRERLFKNVGSMPNVKIDPRAVGESPETGRIFYSSKESTGISGMLAFRETHEQSATVNVTTVSDIIADNEISHIDFLKIDVEGYDFGVLKGVPWDRMKPDIIECEFEDAKTQHLGHSWTDICAYLVDKGYTVYVSEWHPIIRYGISHDWAALKRYPCELNDKNAWGNLLAFKKDPGEKVLSKNLEKILTFRNDGFSLDSNITRETETSEKPFASPPVSPTSEPLQQVPLRNSVVSQPAKLSPSDFAATTGDRFADRLRRRSPALFRIAQAGKWSLMFLKRHFLFSVLATLIISALIAAPFLVPEVTSVAWVFWGAASLIVLTITAILGGSVANMMANKVAERERLERSVMKAEILRRVDRAKSHHDQNNADILNRLSGMEKSVFTKLSDETESRRRLEKDIMSSSSAQKIQLGDKIETSRQNTLSELKFLLEDRLEEMSAQNSQSQNTAIGELRNHIQALESSLRDSFSQAEETITSSKIETEKRLGKVTQEFETRLQESLESLEDIRKELEMDRKESVGSLETKIGTLEESFESQLSERDQKVSELWNKLRSEIETSNSKDVDSKVEALKTLMSKEFAVIKEDNTAKDKETTETLKQVSSHLESLKSKIEHEANKDLTETIQSVVTKEIEQESKRNSTSFMMAQEQLEEKIEKRFSETHDLINQAQKELEKNEDKLRNLDTQSDEVRQSLEKEIKQSKEQVEKLQTMLSTATETIQSMEDQNESLQNEVKGQVLDALTKIDKTDKSTQDTQQKITDLEQKLEEAQQKIASDTNALQTLEGESKKLQAELKSQLLDAISKVDQTDESAQSAHSQIVNLEKKLQETRLQIQAQREQEQAQQDQEKENTPIEFQHFNRVLSKSHIQTLEDNWLKPLNLKESEKSIAYTASRILTLEERMKGRLATSLENAVLRTLVAKSVNGNNLKVLEIGVLFGVGLAMIYDRTVDAFEKVHLTAIDPFEGYYGGNALDIVTNERITENVFLDNMTAARVPEKNLTLIKGFSTDDDVIQTASKTPYDVLIIDGDHSYAGVKADFVNYAPFVKRGGYILIDDDNAPEWPEITKYVDDELLPREDITLVGRSWRTAVFRVVKKIKE